MEICFDTFCENGLGNISMQKLSEACGVTNAALVCYFGTKDNIVIEAAAPLHGSQWQQDAIRVSLRLFMKESKPKEESL